MELEYSSEKVKSQCTSVKAANKLFGGNAALTQSLKNKKGKNCRNHGGEQTL